MIDLKERYFLVSFQFNKRTPADFKLTKVKGEEYCLDKSGNKWTQAYLWDKGWGQEYGFIRFPEPNFKELWSLLLESEISDNQQGAAELLKAKYPEELKLALKELFKSSQALDSNMSNRINCLQLGINCSPIEGKPHTEVEKDFQDWKYLKAEFERLRSKPYRF
ncbi:hypothetical protein [Croceimicrobium hydrocarbonivorans]|uniref:Uncharacterized protein n=1 Tax=Croceimicrobium hydrocarbonivorans TaxID=2761580 RepID=A0A7H0VC26_9FLAO|nr:hypothetical protein [Croceimicrobium hydrocarbonivorans]QNR23274.1 hypothetical protein H4K34_12930 [Croceimicrobium hydrocarbonivorans]